MTHNLITLSSGASANDEFVAELAKPVMIFLALGDGRRESEFVERAQFMLGGKDDPAIVIWAKEPVQVQPALATLRNDAGDVSGAAAVACVIALPTDDGEPRRIVDVIGQHEDPSFFRILQSFTKVTGA